MAPEVRLNGPENESLGIVSLQEALRMAGELDVDLVEIAATAVPPVCRLMDYGKFKYQEQKRAAEAKAKQTVIEIKEVKFRPGTDDGDYNIKLRNIRRFLDDGDKCKITLRFRGREITHQDLGLALLNRLRDDLADSIVVEQFPKLEGRQMIMMIAPGRKKPGSGLPSRQKPPAPPLTRWSEASSGLVGTVTDGPEVRGESLAPNLNR
jgi:translation initiation factor IF-3